MSIKTYVSEKISAYKQKKYARKVLPVGLGIAGFGALSNVGSAALNTTAIIETITGVTTIFPSLGDMVVGIVPTILTLAVVGFILGFFDKILGMVEKFIR